MRTMIAAAIVCGLSLPAVAQDVSGAKDASQRFTTALSAADAATAASFFTDDAVALPPGRAEITGKAEIQRFLSGMTRAVKNLKYTSETVTPIGDTTAREIGSFSFTMNSKDVTGKYLLVWAKVGSDWKIAADMWNRSGGSGGGGQGGKRGKTGGGGTDNQ